MPREAARRDVAARELTAWTVENPPKWQPLSPMPGTWGLSDADAVVDWALLPGALPALPHRAFGLLPSALGIVGSLRLAGFSARRPPSDRDPAAPHRSPCNTRP